MSEAVEHLLALTRAMSSALEKEDLDHCRLLLDERGRLLAELTVGAGHEADPALREALEEIQRMDRAINAALCGRLAETGKEMARLKQTRHATPSLPVSHRCDRQA